MSDKRFEVLFYGDVINCVRDESGKEYNLHETITILNEQQATIDEQKIAIDEMLTDYKKLEKEKEVEYE